MSVARAESLEVSRAGAVTGGAGAPRIAFIDNLRWSMILLVVSMHAADTYSPFGNWYYGDKAATGRMAAMAFGTYQVFLQAFFMSLLFAVSGYFARREPRRRKARTADSDGLRPARPFRAGVRRSSPAAKASRMRGWM